MFIYLTNETICKVHGYAFSKQIPFPGIPRIQQIIYLITFKWANKFDNK